MTEYAVHLADLAVLPAVHPLRWLLGPFMTDRTFNVSSKIDGVAMMLEPVDGRDLDAVVEVTQLAPLPGQFYPIRIYRREDGRWQRVRGGRRDA